MRFNNEALIEEINACHPTPGTCAFWWLGQMSFIVKTATKTLYFDPYLTDEERRLFPSPLRAALIDHADFVFGSHDHTDHIDDATWKAIAAASPRATFVLPSGLAGPVSRRLSLPESRMLPLAADATVSLDGLTIHAIPAAHEQLNDRNENAIFVVSGDGITLCHTGDTCLYEGLIPRLLACGPIDICMLPINGRDARRLRRNCIGNMTYQEAVDLTGALHPRLVIPGHYDMFPDNTENPMLFASYLEIKYPDQDFWIGPHARKILFPY